MVAGTKIGNSSSSFELFEIVQELDYDLNPYIYCISNVFEIKDYEIEIQLYDDLISVLESEG